jgi:pyruvate dehydrogenase E2 component (dihydrolipoamide acetyltransferase)
MPVPIIMPKVDMVMETGTFVEWLAKEGDSVEKDKPLFVILTNKATIEIEAPASGILAGIKAKPDDVIPVAEIIGYILKPGENLPESETRTITTETQTTLPTSSAPEQSAASSSSANQLIRATPLARAIARQKGIDLSSVIGSGARGRIYKADVLAAADQQSSSALKQPLPARSDIQQISLPPARIKNRIPLSGPRAIIARRMAHSAATIPHIYETIAVDMTEAIRLREKIGPVILEHTGYKLTFTTIMAYSVARLLPRHPTLNSSLVNDEIILWEDIHIGIAASLDDVLIVPVIRSAQEKSLEATAAALGKLLDSARNRRLEPADMTGGTFTISNLGMYGIDSFTAIINPPECAILAVGKMANTPVAIDGRVTVRPMLTLTLAFDHRINDGVRAARFLTDLKTMIENPYLLI